MPSSKSCCSLCFALSAPLVTGFDLSLSDVGAIRRVDALGTSEIAMSLVHFSAFSSSKRHVTLRTRLTRADASW